MRIGPQRYSQFKRLQSKITTDTPVGLKALEKILNCGILKRSSGFLTTRPQVSPSIISRTNPRTPNLQEARKLHLYHRHSCCPNLLQNFDTRSWFQGGQYNFAILSKDLESILHRFARNDACQVQVGILEDSDAPLGFHLQWLKWAVNPKIGGFYPQNGWWK